MERSISEGILPCKACACPSAGAASSMAAKPTSVLARPAHRAHGADRWRAFNVRSGFRPRGLPYALCDRGDFVLDGAKPQKLPVGEYPRERRTVEARM